MGISFPFSLPIPTVFNNLEEFSGIGCNLQTPSAREHGRAQHAQNEILTFNEAKKLIFNKLNKLNKKTKGLRYTFGINEI